MSDDPLVCPKRTPAEAATTERHYVPASGPQVCTHANTLEQTLDALRRRFAELERMNQMLRQELLRVDANFVTKQEYQAETDGLREELRETEAVLSEVVCTLSTEFLNLLPTSVAAGLRPGPSCASGVHVTRYAPGLGDLLTWLLGYSRAATPRHGFNTQRFAAAAANIRHYVLVMEQEFAGCNQSRSESLRIGEAKQEEILLLMERLAELRAGDPPISQKAQSETCAES